MIPILQSFEHENKQIGLFVTFMNIELHVIGAFFRNHGLLKKKLEV